MKKLEKEEEEEKRQPMQALNLRTGVHYHYTIMMKLERNLHFQILFFPYFFSESSMAEGSWLS